MCVCLPPRLMSQCMCVDFAVEEWVCFFLFHTHDLFKSQPQNIINVKITGFYTASFGYSSIEVRFTGF